jgi:FlaG/FlaF family flagellin (archaellin)
MITKYTKKRRAISPVLSVLLMIVVAVAGALVTYAWSMGYLDLTTARAGRAIQIQSVALDTSRQFLTIYVQNVGQGAVNLDSTGETIVYLNGALQPTGALADGVLEEGETIPLTIDLGTPLPSNQDVKIKVAGLQGTAIQTTVYPDTTTSGSGTPVTKYRKQITIGTVTGGSHSDFPVMITVSGDTDIGGSTGGSGGSTDGDHIFFTLDDGTTKLDHEVENFSVSGGAASMVAWVRVPSLTSGTIIYLHYGSEVSGGQENPAGVWNSNYRGVWHLSETGTGLVNEYEDSTQNNNDGQGGGGTTNRVPSKVNGKIGYAQDFEGTDSTPDFINVGSSSSLSITGSITIEAWVWVESWEYEYWHMIVARQYGTSFGDGYLLCLRDGGTGYIMVGSNNANRGTVSTGSWYHLVGVASGSTRRLYLNGVGGTTGSGVTWSLDANPVLIGAGENGAPGTFPIEQFDGKIDEVRISNTVRSSDWVITEYNNQNNPSSFYTLGIEESVT